MVDSVGKCG